MQGAVKKGVAMEVVILALVIVTMGLAAAAVGGVFAIYASRQGD